MIYFNINIYGKCPLGRIVYMLWVFVSSSINRYTNKIFLKKNRLFLFHSVHLRTSTNAFTTLNVTVLNVRFIKSE